MISGAKILAATGVSLCGAILFVHRDPGPSESTEAPLVILSGSTMGTYYRVTVSARSHSIDRESLQLEIEKHLAAINNRMSTYQENSEVSRFNRHTAPDWFPVSLDTATVAAAALEVFQRSQGAFDITVGPLVNLWGFGSAPGERTIPSEESVQTGIARTGSQHLEVRSDPPALRKKRGDLQIDLSGIAKGFAVDVLAASLEETGFHHYLVDIGGEMRAKGEKGPGTPWKIGIENPSAQEKGVYEVITLQDRSIATSGDYRNYFEANDQRYSHEIDPKTGRPIDHTLASVSVLHASCMRADAWATALMVLGPQEGLALAEDLNLDTYFVVKTESGFSHQGTGSFGNPGSPPSNNAVKANPSHP